MLKKATISKVKAMSKFSVPATLEGISPLKEGGMSLRFHTQEVSKTEMVSLMNYYQSFGYLLFSPEQLGEEDIPKETLSPDEKKSPSKRLRASLFVLWKQQGGEGDFEAFYRRQMEKAIESVKSKLV